MSKVAKSSTGSRKCFFADDEDYDGWILIHEKGNKMTEISKNKSLAPRRN